MTEIRTEYTLSRINGPSKLLDEALRVYVKYTAPSIRTASNEIVYWAERYNKTFKDELMIFAFHRNKKVIGFVQLVYFREEKLIVIDYAAIAEDYRGQNTFFELVDQVRRYIERLELEINFVVTEVGYFDVGEEPTHDSRKLIRLLKFTGFSIAKARYYQPLLDNKHHESYMRAALMFLRSESTKHIKKETYINILSTIYYKHYIRWNEPFPGIDCSEYTAHINILYKKILKSIKNDMIELNGTDGFVGGALVGKKDDEESIVHKRMLLLLITVIIVFLMLVFTGKFMNIGVEAIVYYVIGALLLVFTIAAVYSNRAYRILDKIIKLIRSPSRK